MGKHHKGFLMTLVERASRFTLAGHVERKTSESVTAEIVRLLKPHAAGVLSITFDNGREFAGHLDVAAALDCRTYFAKPYHSWERGGRPYAYTFHDGVPRALLGRSDRGSLQCWE